MEKRPIFILLGLLACGAVAAEQAYTWTDEDGVVHYSDRPQPGAKVVNLGDSDPPRPRAAARPQAAARPSTTDEPPEEAAAFRYETLEVVAPAPEETLWNIGGVLTVSLSVSPALRAGDQVRVYFDGQAQLVSGTSFQLQEVWRGVHNIQAEVLDENGNMMIRSLPNRFYVQQNKVNF